MDKSICFTGRRPKDLLGYDKKSYVPMVDALKRDIAALHQNYGFSRFISGGAQGFDQLAFWAVNALKRDQGLNIKNIVYVPFKEQECMWKQQGLFSQTEYGLMLSLADEVIIIADINRSDKRAIVKAMHDRNHAMVDASNLVFGLYPDFSWSMPDTKGGTAECLKYALSKDKQIFQMFFPDLTSGFLKNN